MSHNRAATIEHERIRFLVDRDGPPAAREWVKRTLAIYREAMNSPGSHASTPHYRPMFQASIEVFEQWLGIEAPAGNMHE